MLVDLSDAEIDQICAGRIQNAAKVRHLRAMGLWVRQKPNGKPLVNRLHYDQVTSGKSEQHSAAEPAWSIN